MRRGIIRAAHPLWHHAATRRDVLLAPRAGAGLMPAIFRMISPRRGSFTRFAALAAGIHWKSRSALLGPFPALAPHPQREHPHLAYGDGAVLVPLAVGERADRASADLSHHACFLERLACGRAMRCTALVRPALGDDPAPPLPRRDEHDLGARAPIHPVRQRGILHMACDGGGLRDGARGVCSLFDQSSHSIPSRPAVIGVSHVGNLTYLVGGPQPRRLPRFPQRDNCVASTLLHVTAMSGGCNGKSRSMPQPWSRIAAVALPHFRR